MGGQFTYYINGVDDRVKGAVGIAVAGDWRHISFYPGSWLYHGLYYYTRDGLPSGRDYLNTVSNFCTDPTLTTFLNYFDPIAYAPTQHGPLLTIIGSHDQFFTVPAINSTYRRIASAGTSERFRKRIMIKPNGKHGVLRDENLYEDAYELIQDIHAWFKYCFNDGPRATRHADGSHGGETDHDGLSRDRSCRWERNQSGDALLRVSDGQQAFDGS